MSLILNLDKVKEIWKNKLRRDRKPVLESLDVDFMRAVESNDIELQKQIISKKQQLRDITELVELAETLEELQAIKVPEIK